MTTRAAEKALDIIRRNDGIIRTKDAIAQGIQTRTLRRLIDEDRLEQISRGLYRLSECDPVSNPDLFTVAARVPKGIICLISALAFHDITTQIPYKVYIALDRKTETPRLEYPPLSIHRFSGKAYSEGIETHIIDGTEVKIYSQEKTLADSFKFRNQIGMDVVLEALRIYRSKRKINMQALFYFARVCRVEHVMKPYIESIL